MARSPSSSRCRSSPARHHVTKASAPHGVGAFVVLGPDGVAADPPALGPGARNAAALLCAFRVPRHAARLRNPGAYLPRSRSMELLPQPGVVDLPKILWP